MKRRVLTAASALLLAAAAPLGAQSCAAIGLQVSRPTAVSIGLSCVRPDSLWSWQPMASVEVGTAGAKLMTGLARVELGEVLISQQIRVGLMRTWGDPWHAGPDELYAGLELRWGIGFTAGPSVFYRVSPDGRVGRWLGGWSVGFWF